MTTKPTPRTCKNGHTYYKTSDCPTCPHCEQARPPAADFFSGLVAPARRALENNGVLTVQQLALLREAEVLQFHGIGPSSLLKLRQALAAHGLAFKP